MDLNESLVVDSNLFMQMNGIDEALDDMIQKNINPVDVIRTCEVPEYYNINP